MKFVQAIALAVAALCTVAVSTAHASQPKSVTGVVLSVQLQNDLPELGGTYSTLITLVDRPAIKFKSDGRTEWIPPLLERGDRVSFKLASDGSVVDLERIPRD